MAKKPAQRLETALYSYFPGAGRLALVDQTGLPQAFFLDHDCDDYKVGAIYALPIRKKPKNSPFGFAQLPPLAGQTAKAQAGAAAMGLVTKIGPHSEGEMVIAQITRAAHDEKGPQLSLDLQFKGRYLDYFPTKPLPEKQGDKAPSPQIQQVLDAVKQTLDGGSFSLNPPAHEVGEAAIIAEANWLKSQYEAVMKAAKSAPKNQPSLLAPAPPLWMQAVWSLATGGHLFTDDADGYHDMKSLSQSLWPDLDEGLSLERKTPDLWQDSGMDDALSELTQPEIQVEDFATLYFEKTRALWTIDVDIAAHAWQADDVAISRLNQRLAPEIARQIRLRDLSGVIFVDLPRLKNRNLYRPLLDVYKAAFREAGRAQTLFGFGPAGLLELQRQRFGPDLSSRVNDPIAKGAGLIRQFIKDYGKGGKPPPELTSSRDFASFYKVTDPAIIAGLDGPLAPALAKAFAMAGLR